MEVATYFIVFRRYLAESRDAFTSPILLHALSYFNNMTRNVISFNKLVVGVEVGYYPVLWIRRDCNILYEHFAWSWMRDGYRHEFADCLVRYDGYLRRWYFVRRHRCLLKLLNCEPAVRVEALLSTLHTTLVFHD